MKTVKIEKDINIKVPSKIEYFLNPDYIYIPIIDDNLYVSQNEYIYKGDIVSSNNKISSVSGKAYGIKKCNVLGNSQNTLVVANDFREFSKNKVNRKKNITIATIIKVLEDNKSTLLDKFKSNKVFDNIVIKAFDDNPYVYNNIFLLKEKIIEVLDLVEKLSLIYTSKSNYLIIKNIDAFIIDECLKVIGTYPNTQITLVNDQYLLEQDVILKDKLRLSKNTLYLSVNDLVYLNDLLNNNNESTCLITISGDAICENKVIRVKKYTLLNDVLDKFIKIDCKKYDVIVNGLLTGFKIKNNDNLIISNSTKSINIMKKRRRSEGTCIKCGLCSSVCPYGVNPVTLNNKDKCIDCGLCSYVCPSFINLRKKLKVKK